MVKPDLISLAYLLCSPLTVFPFGPTPARYWNKLPAVAQVLLLFRNFFSGELEITFHGWAPLHSFCRCGERSQRYAGVADHILHVSEPTSYLGTLLIHAHAIPTTLYRNRTGSGKGPGHRPGKGSCATSTRSTARATSARYLRGGRLHGGSLEPPDLYLTCLGN